MKIKTGIIVLALSGLAAIGPAHAFSGGHCGDRAAKGDSMEKVAASRLEKLHAELKLAPEQEKAWKSWSEPLLARAAGAQERRPDFAALEKLPAPERMAQMLERMKAREKEMEGQLASLREFYGTLTAEQKQVLDGFRPFGGRHGRGDTQTRR